MRTRSPLSLLVTALAAFMAFGAAPAMAHHDAKHTDNTAAFCERKLENGQEHKKCVALPCPEGEFRDPATNTCQPCDPVIGCPTQQMSANHATTNDQFAAMAASGFMSTQVSAGLYELSVTSDPIGLDGPYYRATYYTSYPQVVLEMDGQTRAFGWDLNDPFYCNNPYGIPCLGN